MLGHWEPASPQGEDTLLVEDRFFGSFENASRITVDSRGFILVIDEAAHSVLVFDSPDHQPRVLGGYGWDQTTFDRPTGVATDVLNIYVADFGNHRVNRFDRQLTFLSSLSTRDTTFEIARFGYPRGVALSRQGDLFVLDGENLKVVQFNGRSGFVRTFGGIESSEGRLREPVEIEVSNDDKIRVLETDRVVEFDFAGNYVRSIGEGVIRNSKGMCLARNGFLVVSNDTLRWFHNDGSVRMTLAASEILGEFPASPLRDVVVWKDRLLLLTPVRVGVFQVESAAR